MNYYKLSLKVERFNGSVDEIELEAGDLARLTVLTQNYVNYLKDHNPDNEFERDIAEYQGLLDKLNKVY